MRFRILDLIIWLTVFGIMFALWRIKFPEAMIFTPYVLLPVFCWYGCEWLIPPPSRKAVSRFLRILFWVTVTLTALVSIGCSAFARNGTALPMLVVLAVYAEMLVVIFWIRLNVVESSSRGKLSRESQIGLALLVVVGIVPFTDWPLQLSFLISSASLNELADRVERGEEIQFPQSAGLLVVHSATNRKGVIALWTNQYYGGREGVLRYPPSGNGPQFNTWRKRQINAQWIYITED